MGSKLELAHLCHLSVKLGIILGYLTRGEFVMKQEITLYTPDLSAIPGWVSMNRGQQDWLLEQDSQAHQLQRLEGMSAISGALKLIEIEAGLQGTEMSFTSYLRGSFGQSERTAWRRVKDFKELAKHMPPAVIKAIASNGSNLLRGVSGSGVRDLISAAKELPPPKSANDKVIEGYITNDLRGKLREIRQERRPKGPIKLTDEMSAKMALHSVIRYMRVAKMKTSAEKRHWLTRVLGWAMEAEAVSGTLRAGRIPIPDGTLIRRGRPRKKKSA